MRVTDFIKKKLEVVKPYLFITSDEGCPRIATASMDEAVTVVKEAIIEADVGGQLKIGIDMRSSTYKAKDDDGSFLGCIYHPSQPHVDGSVLIESLFTLWKDSEYITIEDATDGISNIASLRGFVSSITEYISEIMRDVSDAMPYAINGVDNDGNCQLSTADSSIQQYIVTKEDAIRLNDVKVYNTSKIRLSKCGYVSKAIDVCKLVNSCGWSTIIGCDEGSPECSESFVSDFAVAVGAGQISCGGYGVGEHSCKYNRLIEISREDDTISFFGKKFRQ